VEENWRKVEESVYWRKGERMKKRKHGGGMKKAKGNEIVEYK
jgi:hypothetical protein